MTRTTSYPYEVFNPNSHRNQMRKALRAMRGHPCYELRFEAGEDEAKFLADFMCLTRDEDRTDEVQLSSALAKLLKMAMELRKEVKAHE